MGRRLLLFVFFWFLGPCLGHMEVPGLGIELELQLPAYTTATATQDPSCICDLHHSSWQYQILNPLSKARDRTRNLMIPSWIRQPLSHNRNSQVLLFIKVEVTYNKLYVFKVYNLKILTYYTPLKSSL